MSAELWHREQEVALGLSERKHTIFHIRIFWTAFGTTPSLLFSDSLESSMWLAQIQEVETGY